MPAFFVFYLSFSYLSSNVWKNVRKLNKISIIKSNTIDKPITIIIIIIITITIIIIIIIIIIIMILIINIIYNFKIKTFKHFIPISNQLNSITKIKSLKIVNLLILHILINRNESQNINDLCNKFIFYYNFSIL
jgi:hypothetical protein